MGRYSKVIDALLTLHNNVTGNHDSLEDVKKNVLSKKYNEPMYHFSEARGKIVNHKTIDAEKYGYLGDLLEPQ